ncbi:hypothetical protein GUJ93_ZPchr0004g40234 [Zizania palustris]|uniref:Uncharacterized protein n=1 Tax=Zizania palustris TaxID=103762 RepID=A0A8J5S6Q3_ZIZPA|nr:hypothetical protein GUJ93_ZPchr0004g40234 [Zizania palustris]
MDKWIMGMKVPEMKMEENQGEKSNLLPAASPKTAMVEDTPYLDVADYADHCELVLGSKLVALPEDVVPSVVVDVPDATTNRGRIPFPLGDFVLVSWADPHHSVAPRRSATPCRLATVACVPPPGCSSAATTLTPQIARSAPLSTTRWPSLVSAPSDEASGQRPIFA